MGIPKGGCSMARRINKNKGFTLIELLIVVAIIGILTAISIPQFAAYRARAYNSAAHTDLRAIKLHMEYYYADIHAYPVFP
jgi:type IV pilus assembly protein PilA